MTDDSIRTTTLNLVEEAHQEWKAASADSFGPDQKLWLRNLLDSVVIGLDGPPVFVEPRLLISRANQTAVAAIVAFGPTLISAVEGTFAGSGMPSPSITPRAAISSISSITLGQVGAEIGLGVVSATVAFNGFSPIFLGGSHADGWDWNAGLRLARFFPMLRDDLARYSGR